MAGLTFAFTVLILGIVHGSVVRFDDGREFKCTRTCPVVEQRGYHFSPGKTYIYRLETQTQVRLRGRGSWIRVKGTAEITPANSCNYILTLSGISLEDSEPDGAGRGRKEFEDSLERFPLVFGFSNGRILSVCPAAEEEEWGVNVKKGLLSALQNTMTSDTYSKGLERDVMGECVTEYERLSSPRSRDTSVKKTKNLLSCRDRASHRGSLQSAPFTGTQQDSVHSLPLLKSTYKCVQTFSGGRRFLEQVQCEESELFQPFSEGGSGVKSVSTLSLTYQRHSPPYTPPRVSYRKSKVEYESVEKRSETESAEREALAALRKLCALAEEGIDSDTPALFAHFRHSLKGVSNLHHFYTRTLR